MPPFVNAHVVFESTTNVAISPDSGANATPTAGMFVAPPTKAAFANTWTLPCGSVAMTLSPDTLMSHIVVPVPLAVPTSEGLDVFDTSYASMNQPPSSSVQLATYAVVPSTQIEIGLPEVWKVFTEDGDAALDTSTIWTP